MTMVVTTVDLLRHGEPEGGDMFRGANDVALSEAGWTQMQRSTGRFMTDGFPWQHIISSPLSRCRAFAAHLAHTWELPLQEHAGFREISFGDWDGVHFDTLQQCQPVALKAYWQDPVAHTPPNGEPMVDFQQRVQQAWAWLIDRYQGSHVLLVAHGGVNRVLMAEALAMPLSSVVRIEVPYACLTRLRIYHQEGRAPWPQLVFHGGPEP